MDKLPKEIQRQLLLNLNDCDREVTFFNNRDVLKCDFPRDEDYWNDKLTKLIGITVDEERDAEKIYTRLSPLIRLYNNTLKAWEIFIRLCVEDYECYLVFLAIERKVKINDTVDNGMFISKLYTLFAQEILSYGDLRFFPVVSEKAFDFKAKYDDYNNALSLSCLLPIECDEEMRKRYQLAIKSGWTFEGIIFDCSNWIEGSLNKKVVNLTEYLGLKPNQVICGVSSVEALLTDKRQIWYPFQVVEDLRITKEYIFSTDACIKKLLLIKEESYKVDYSNPLVAAILLCKSKDYSQARADLTTEKIQAALSQISNKCLLEEVKLFLGLE